jgi:hypothetical protein
MGTSRFFCSSDIEKGINNKNKFFTDELSNKVLEIIKFVGNNPEKQNIRISYAGFMYFANKKKMERQ